MEAESRINRDQTIRYLVRATRRAYGLPLAQAIAAVDMLMGATGRAGSGVADGELKIDDAIDLCVGSALGGLERLSSSGQRARVRARWRRPGALGLGRIVGRAVLHAPTMFAG